MSFISADASVFEVFQSDITYNLKNCGLLSAVAHNNENVRLSAGEFMQHITDVHRTGLPFELFIEILYRTAILPFIGNIYHHFTSPPNTSSTPHHF